MRVVLDGGAAASELWQSWFSEGGKTYKRLKIKIWQQSPIFSQCSISVFYFNMCFMM
jgi:hypothetical protein